MNSSVRKAVVTGANGFVGTALCAQLQEHGFEVTRIVGSRARGELSHVADLSRAGSWTDLITAGTIVFHLAGRASVPDSVTDPLSSKIHNLDATVNVLDAARKSGAAVLLASTGAVYADSGNPWTEDSPIAPRSPYAAAKLAAEHFAAAYTVTYGMRVWTARLFSVYGPRMRGMAMRDFVRRLSDDPTQLRIRGDGQQIRDYIHVDDAARALLQLVECAPCGVYNVASGQDTTIAELAASVAAVCGFPECRIVPDGINPAGEPLAMRADVTRLQATGFSPQIMFEAGLAATVAWLQTSIKENNDK